MLRTALGALIAGYLEDPGIVEIMLNPDGRLWVDRLSTGLEDTTFRVAPADAERIVRLVAHHVGVEVHAGAAIHIRHHQAITGSNHGAAASSAVSSDSLSHELARCTAAGMDPKNNPACEAAWAENRRRFFTYRPSPQTVPAPANARGDGSPQ